MKAVKLAAPPNLGLNVVANYIGRFWSIASVYLFVPLYIRFLGIDAYGLIAFNAVVLAMIFIADGGLSAAFAREAAKGQSGKPLLDALVSIERILWCILAFIGISFAVAAPLIADRWLGHVPGLDRQIIIHSLQLMPLAFVPQIAMSLYFGGLMGLERQVAGNTLSTISNIIRSGCVVIPIYFVPDIRMFFVWQAAACILMVIIMRIFLIRCIRNSKNGPHNTSVNMKGDFSLSMVLEMGLYTVGMFAMSIIAAFNTQIDKIVVSNVLPLARFAEYALISTLAQIPFILTLPVALALLPRFTKFIELGNKEELTRLYRISTYYISAVGASAGFVILLFIDDIMVIWLSGHPMSEGSSVAARVLALGSIALTLQLTVYQMSLAYGHIATNIKLGAVMLSVSIPLQIILTVNYGLFGASLPWLIMNSAAFIFLGIALNLRFPLTSLRTYFFVDTLPPILIAGIVIVVARIVAMATDDGALAACFIAGFSALVALAISHVVRQRITFSVPFVSSP